MGMEWEEISRRLRNGTSVQILADLDGCTYKTMYNRIRQHEKKEGKNYINPEQMKRPFETKRKKEPEQDEPENKSAYVPEVEPIGEEKAPALPEVVKEFAGIPEGVVKETLEKYKKEQANAVGAMHAIETMYKLAKARELKLRTVVLALERLLEGESL